MMENKQVPSFSDKALAKMHLAQGKTVEKIIIHLWQNMVNPSQSVEVIHSLQLRFTDGFFINIGCHHELEALEILDDDIQDQYKQLEIDFGGKIKIHALEAGKTKMWQGISGLVLESIQITKDDDFYKADSILLNFGTEKRTVSASPEDGIIIDYYEE